MNGEQFVVDTHPLVWWATDRPRKLGRRARAVFEGYEEQRVVLHVPAAVVLETWFLTKNGRIRPEGSLARWWERIRSPNLLVEPLEAADVLTAASLSWSHPDVYDRLIVATAARLGLPLVTADSAIEDSGLTPTVW